MEYTPLNSTREEIMRIEDLPPPKLMSKKSADTRDPKKFCNFHKDIGYTTEECIQLKRENQRLINRGDLGRNRQTKHRGITAVMIGKRSIR